MKNKVATIFLLIAFIFFMGACAGNNSSESGAFDFVGAGLVKVFVKPSSIDVGDRAKVTIDIDKANKDGVIVKVRFSSGLKYVRNSALLYIDNNEFDAIPNFNLTDDMGKNVYLVFFLSSSDFNENGSASLVFELEGIDRVTDGLVEVDIDVDDVDIPNQDEFDIDNPEFQTSAEADIEVIS